MNISMDLSSAYFFLIVQVISLIAKLYTLVILLQQRIHCSSAKKAWFYITLILCTTTLESFAWIIKLCSITNLISIPNALVLIFIRLAWAGSVTYYQSLVLFFHQLIKRNQPLGLIEKTSTTISSLLVAYYVGLALLDFNSSHSSTLEGFISMRPLESHVMTFSVLFGAVLVISYTFLIIANLKKLFLPKILKIQLNLFMVSFIAPYVVTELITQLQMMAYMWGLLPAFQESLHYFISAIYTILITYGLSYCIQKVMGLRFLNIQEKVKSFRRFSVIDDFTVVLDQLSLVDELKNLEQTVQRFFKDAFAIPFTRTSLYIRQLNGIDEDKGHSLAEQTMEQFLNTYMHNAELAGYMQSNRVFIQDEVEFSNFYDKSSAQALMVQLLDSLKADVLIPIYDRKTLLAYIIIERHARPHELYTDVEQNEMLVLARYLANIIKLIQHRNLASLLEQEHKMEGHIEHKDRELQHYREGLRSFFHSSHDRKIGIIFHRNRRFVIANQAAQDILRININTQIGHPLTKALKQITKQVEETKAPYSVIHKDVKGKRLVLAGLPSIDQSYAIIALYYPEISDLLARRVNIIQESSDWDYLLYLETTQNGKLIHQFVPADSPTLLRFKIQFFKQALKSRVTVLQMHEKDLMPTVELLQHIVHSTAIHTITLTKPCTTIDTAVSIFGLNPLFGTHKEAPLLEQLSNKGTLFIRNIHYLDREAQEHLAEYLRFGLYRMFKSERTMASKARIICSTPVSLEDLVAEDKFSQNLYEELKSNQIIFPSLATLSDQELQELALGYAEQAIISPTFKNLLDLTEHELERFIARRPASLQEIKDYIQRLLTSKTTKHQLTHENNFDPAFGIADPKLAEAARLGKRALRHPEIMDMLWKKFKNQNKIAIFLGVNRSSVNRRCRRYKLSVTVTKGKKEDMQ